jgi:hypothetical protein
VIFRYDNCSRVSPEIRRLAIGVNDWRGWESDEERTAHLCPLVPLLLDTIAPRPIVQRRLWIMANTAVRVIAPLSLDARAAHWKANKDEKREALCPRTGGETARM